MPVIRPPQPAPDSDRWMSRLELAELFNLSERTVDRHIKAGLCPAVRVGSRTLITPEGRRTYATNLQAGMAARAEEVA